MSDSSFQDSVKAAFLECFGMESKAAQLAYLSNLHPRDPQIAEAVGELLNLAGTRIDSILQNSDHSPLGQDSLPASTQPTAAGSPQGPGTLIDRYKILKQIGEGGMGTVFMAQQTSPIKRRVALKIVKPGMDSEQVIARFEAERQALALMEHPNIAKVFDAGTTDQGRPYFVMELVKGVPLTKFCQTERLSIEERLQLFTELCHGIQHAHQKGIIHRDIKPSNVLVTLHDDKPVVKIIDFGIAKAINQNLTEATLLTRYSQMMGTPLYMSPEQAEISGLDVDTRSDVYSLGVMLYELITDTTPFDGDSLRRAGVDEIRRIIRETDPPRPSQRLTTTSGTESTFGKGGERNLRSIHLKLAGELDWIVMKAIEKERERRYESPRAFAADINRFLTDQPVQACPPSIGYRLSKAFRKHRLIAISSVWIAATLLIGLFATVVQWRRAELLVVSEREQRRRAEDASAVELKARTLADARLYVNQIRLAHTEWEHGDHVVAKRALETTAVPQRAFEYYLLKQKFSADTVAVGTGHEGAILSLHYNPVGTLIATCGEDRTIRLWDADSATELRVIEGHADVVHEVSFLPDGKTLVSCSADKSLRLWNVESGKEIRRIDHDDEVTALAVTVDGSLIASGTAGCLVKIWDVESGEAIQEFEPNSGRVITLSFSADGRGLASGTDQNDLDFWQIGESNNWFVNIIDNVVPKLAGWPAHVTQHFEGHTSSVNGVVFSPFEIPDCGPLAISGGDDGMIKGWDWQYGSQVLYYDGHIKPVLDLQPSRDGMRFVSAGVDSTVRVWDVNGAFELFRLRGHSDAVQCAGFNHDGSRVASGGADGKLLI